MATIEGGMREPRHAIRVAVIEPAGAIFLLRYENVEVGRHWAMPGGGIDPGESLMQAARRELLEETGWDDVELSGELWTWEHDFTHTERPVRQRERALLCRAPRRDPIGDLRASHDNDLILGWRWWTPTELAGCPDALWPPQLASLLADLLRKGAPGSPIDLGYSG